MWKLSVYTITEASLTNIMKNKDKPKKGHLPAAMHDEGRYLAAQTCPDYWICYPWEATYVSVIQSDPYPLDLI